MKAKRFIYATAAALLAVSVNGQTTVTQWDFTNSGFYDTDTNTPSPSTGTGSAAMVGINDPDGDFTNTSAINTWRIRGSGDVGANGWDQDALNASQGAQFNVSTVGFSDVNVSLTWWATNNAIKHAQFQYTTNGTDWTNFGDIAIAGNATDFTAGGETFATVDYDLSSISAVNDNEDFGFRFVAVYSPVGFTDNDNTWAADSGYMVARFDTDGDTRAYDGGSGNWRFSDVTVSAIPEPETYAAMVGLLAIGLAFARRCFVAKKNK